ncbi:uncharacterized protein LOC100142081 [Tribolium castaneum]|uniref:Uncharacterized protein n=1 Tax=Tribolium castaneum TaxID=7070 RepID=A0A139WH82_TRICA|nr:PREDICTED: uncharacterized protein LOC100142081 [Tribolium castaneum]KYB27244.1 hypothetical protein TcasGA2_TC033159 [Tribolium castaneum]|eukprot:XP_008193879.1 PREDICTED: uncharacterized protein LOC100142081 [Tribolium castaneum]
MSINVTVSGNPVRINRGKMVTSYDPVKAEFDKRRLMRLEQVRQQSKDIAENVRNKLKKEKSKQLSQIEKDGEVRLKNWQARKLLELQNQYQEAIEEIGLGHKEAARVAAEEEAFFEDEEVRERVAEERGREAVQRLQIERNEESLKRAVPVQRKKLTRDEENSRSNAVVKKVKQKQSPFKKKKTQVFDSDSENRVPLLEGLGGDSDWNSDLGGTRRVTGARKVATEVQTSPTIFEIPTSDKAAQTNIHESAFPSTSEFPYDTRISERIKRRAILKPETDYCNFAEKEVPRVIGLCPCCLCHGKHLHGVEPVTIDDRPDVRATSAITVRDEGKSEKGQAETHPQNLDDVSESTVPQKTNATSKEDLSLRQSRRVPQRPEQVTKPKPDIPTKPKVTLKSTKKRPENVASGSGPQKVQFYDHPNRYTKFYVPKTSHVEKIDDENIIISPNVLSEEEMYEKMRQRDREAHLRGQVALEKERIQREYRDLMKKLPVLQKQERIAEIGLDKEKYHMSGDRLEELEKRRQNRLDNAYEELLVSQKPALVTLPRKNDDRSENHSLNLAWDVDFEPKSSTNHNRTEQLSHLLTTLKSQKSHLLKEIENTLSKESSSQFDEVKSKSTDYPRRKRSRDDRPISPTTSDVIPEEETTTVKTKPGRKSTTGAPSPRKKRKTSRKVLVKQNSSTQTSPKSGRSVATSPHVNTPVEDSCKCSKKDSSEEVCEVVIKIKDGEKPEVVVQPPFSEKSVKVVTEVEEGKDVERPASWREELTRTASSSSTSYLEPPQSGRSDSILKKIGDMSRTMDSTVSSGASGKQLDPRLLVYIKKLLNMSRASIDDLTISASDVSTPSHSVVETPSNNPLLKLLNVMKYYNLDVADLQKQLSYETDDSGRHYNTSESIAVTTSTSEGDKSVQFKSCTEVDTSSKVEGRKIQDYANMAASCTKKISSLTAMIEKLRAEKKKMMSSGSSGSDKDLTLTSYLQLPDKSPKQDEIDAKLLDIDYNYAEKLKQLSREELQVEKQKVEVREPTDQELLTRLKSLLQDSNSKNKDKRAVESTKKFLQKIDDTCVTLINEKKLFEDKQEDRTVGQVSEKTSVSLKDDKTPQSFPLLLDIPKLPRLEAPSLEKKRKKRPPPTKTLRPIPEPVVPHELSTIIEADSQLSAKAESPVKPKGRPGSSGSKSGDVPDILTEVVKDKSSTNSSDLSEMETMETMLMSIGMEWAIPTLKKTREALALTSSSSGSKESGELSLREFLSKISSSSDVMSASDSQGMSLIHDDNRMTSTPIAGYGEKKDGQPIFLTDSDLSSVKENSGRAKDVEQRFFELQDHSGKKE